MTLHFTPIPTDTVRTYRAGGLDANGQPPERHMADGSGNPCRHCLDMIPKGTAMLVLAHCPFSSPQPYAEIGPIFLCALDCAAGGGPSLPAILNSPAYILRGYGADHRIIYGTGSVVPTSDIPAKASALLSDRRVAYAHVRSASNNCVQVEIIRA